MNEWCRVWMSVITYVWVMSHMNWVMVHMNATLGTHKCIMSRIWMCHMANIHASCMSYLPYRRACFAQVFSLFCAYFVLNCRCSLRERCMTRSYLRDTLARMHHVTYTNESWCSHEHVTPHRCMCHAAHLNAPCCTHACATLHTWMRHFAHMHVYSMSHMCMRHARHILNSCHIGRVLVCVCT